MHPNKRHARFDVPRVVLRTAQNLGKRRRQSNATHVLQSDTQRPRNPTSYEAEKAGVSQRVLRIWVRKSLQLIKVLVDDLEYLQYRTDDALVDNDFSAVESDLEEARSEQSQCAAQECSEREKTCKERLDAAGDASYLIDYLLVFGFTDCPNGRCSLVARLKPMLARLLPVGICALNNSTPDDDHVLIHPHSTMTTKALAICLSDIQTKHGLTIQCLRAICALLKQCFPTIKLPSISPTSANPYQQYVGKDTMVEVHVCSKGCLAYIGESLNRYVRARHSRNYVI